MGPSPRRPGFRLTAIDACVILPGAALTALCWDAIGSFGPVFALALVHYFLFRCIFRVRRIHILVWGAIFIANVLVWWLIDKLDGWSVLAEQTPVTLVIIGLEIRRSHYRGVGHSLKQAARG